MDNFNLPEKFIERMRADLGDEFEAFIDSYEKPYRSALRVNPLKVKCISASAPGKKESVVVGVGGDIVSRAELSLEQIQDLLLDSGVASELEQVPWCPEGFYFGENDRPGKHPLHDAGLYYIQEPSAMSVATKAGAKPGMRVLDLCAAPGGKTTALAAAMRGEGLLVANEIHPARAKILSQNVERMGIRNCIVTNESPAALAAHFPMFFDLIVVDAPCSGEGMFRKEPAALECWSEENVFMCAERQREILTSAVSMLASGGRLVYSTCTFAKEEDEEIVQWIAGSSVNTNLRVISNEKFYPHKIDGEGHFVAVLQDISEVRPRENFEKKRKKKDPVRDLVNTWNSVKSEFVGNSFLKNSVTSGENSGEISGEKDSEILYEPSYISFGDNLYLMPEEMNLRGLKVLRPGLQLGEVRKGRFIPSHALALALRPSEAAQAVDISTEDARRFIAGEEISISSVTRIWKAGAELPADEIAALSGWVLVTTCGVSLGWAKASGGRLKNHFPKGLRHT